MNLSYNERNDSDYPSSGPTLLPCPVYASFESNFVHTFSLVLSSFALLSNFSFIITVKKTNCLGKVVAIHLVALSFVDISISCCFITGAFRWLFDFANGIINLSTHTPPYLFRFPLQVLASILVVSVTADRYRAIANPIESAASGVSSRLRLMIILTILTCSIMLLFAIAHSIFLFGMEYISHCVMGNNVYELLLASTLSPPVANTINMSVLYISVTVDVVAMVTSVCLLTLMKRRLAKAPDMGLPARYQSEQRNLTKMIMINTTVFLVCILFQDVMVLAYNYFLMVTTDVLEQMIALCSLINSSVNPVIYNIFSSRYRQAFRETFPCLTCPWWKRKREAKPRGKEEQTPMAKL